MYHACTTFPGFLFSKGQEAMPISAAPNSFSVSHQVQGKPVPVDDACDTAHGFPVGRLQDETYALGVVITCLLSLYSLMPPPITAQGI